jgi:hypothetical protein
LETINGNIDLQTMTSQIPRNLRESRVKIGSGVTSTFTIVVIAMAK